MNKNKLKGLFYVLGFAVAIIAVFLSEITFVYYFVLLGGYLSFCLLLIVIKFLIIKKRAKK